MCLLAVDGPVALKAAGALRNLAMFAAPRGPMVEAGAVRPLAAMLSHESDEVRSVAAAALCNLAKSEVLQTQIVEVLKLFRIASRVSPVSVSQLSCVVVCLTVFT